MNKTMDLSSVGVFYVESPAEAIRIVADHFHSTDVALTFGLSALNFAVTSIYLRNMDDAGIQERIAGFVSPGC